MSKPKNPAKVKLTTERLQKLEQFLSDQLNRALSARGAYIQDGGYLDTWHALYEQQARPESERPFEGAADLVTYIVTEKVDALCARLVSIIFNMDPICVAEPWGNADPTRTARVEAFMQWQAEEEKLKTWVSKAIKMSLIEQSGILAIDERPTLEKIVRSAEVKIQTTEDGMPVIDAETGEYAPAMNEDGTYAEFEGADDPDQPRIKALITETKPVGFGPQYRIVGLKNFLFLPAHAEDIGDVFGFAERIWMRVQDIRQMVDAGLYDADTLDRIGGDAAERMTGSTEQRKGITAEQDNGDYAEKELWKLHLQYDIDEDGIPEWLMLTYSITHNALVKCDYDTLNQVRYVPFTPLLDPENVYGQSFVGHKLWTIADEHTALRNMIADRNALVTNAPMKRLTTSTYDADDQPWGIGAILDVRDMNDLQPIQVPDVPASGPFLLNHTEQAAERLSGMNDAAVGGVLNSESRTATEVTTAAQASYVRISEMMNHLRDSISTLYDLRLQLWKRALEARKDGIAAPSSVMRDLESRGVEVPTNGPLKFMADDLSGPWRFKPRGSVETADEGAMRGDFNAFLAQVLPTLVQAFPSLAPVMQSPEFAKSMLGQSLRLYRVQDSAAIMKAIVPQALPPQPGPGAPQGQPGATPAGLPADITAMLSGMGGQGAPVPPQQPVPVVPQQAPPPQAPIIPGQPQ